MVHDGRQNKLHILNLKSGTCVTKKDVPSDTTIVTDQEGLADYFALVRNLISPVVIQGPEDEWNEEEEEEDQVCLEMIDFKDPKYRLDVIYIRKLSAGSVQMNREYLVCHGTVKVGNAWDGEDECKDIVEPKLLVWSRETERYERVTFPKEPEVDPMEARYRRRYPSSEASDRPVVDVTRVW